MPIRINQTTNLLLAVLFASLTCTAVRAEPGEGRVHHLRCDALENPLGIDDPTPQLSWQMDDTRRGARQTAYQILVSADAAALKRGAGDVWDSGKRMGFTSINVRYGGPALASGHRYFWAVRIWDAEGKALPQSQPAWWETAFLNGADWKAKWISRPDNEQEADRSAGVKWIWVPGEDALNHVQPGKRYFRYTFRLDALPRTATLLVAGKDSVQASVNGTPLAPSDTWGTFQVVDVGKLLKTGENTVSSTVTTSGTGGFAALLKYQGADGVTQRIPSDARWQASTSEQAGFVPAAVLAELGAKPIGDPWPPSPANYFRKAFKLNKTVSKARLYITALGTYKAYLNGERIGDTILSPGWTDYSKRIQYQSYDVTALVRKGANAISAVVGDGWYASGLGWKLQRHLYGGQPLSLLSQLEITYSDNTTETVASDDSWRTSTGAIVTDEIYAGERYDARKAQSFASTNFSDAHWTAATTGGAVAGALVAQSDQPIRVTETLHPKATSSPAPGVYIFDIGQNVTGWARLKLHAPAGTEVRMRFAEILKPDGNIYTDNLRSAKATDTYVASGRGEELYEPSFTYHGFRYIELTGYPGKPSADAVVVTVFHSAMPETGTFETSSELVNQIWRNILWGQRDNFMSVPTDCPQRDERLGWMADAQIFWQTAAYNMDMEAFANKWLQDVRDAQSPAGAFSDVSPRVVDLSDGAPGWGDAGVIVPWITWQQYGDVRTLQKQWDAMTKWLQYIHEANADFIWQNRRNNDFGDWVPANSETPKELIATAFWAYDAKLMSQMGDALGKHDEAAEYRSLFDQIKTAFNARFVKGALVGNGSQTCDVLALFVGLLPDDLRSQVADHLEHDIESRQGHLSTGFVGTAFLMPALTANGKNATAYRLLLNEDYPSWGYMVRKGATTMWERWNGDTGDPSMNSYNHYAFGAVGEWLYQDVAGIQMDPASPGFQKIVIHPRPDARITRCRASYASPYGKISSEWIGNPGKPFQLNVTIPANTTAQVYLPASEGARILEASKALGPDIHQLPRDGDSAVLEIPSGTYSFEVQ